jgi:hypothetical protein
MLWSEGIWEHWVMGLSSMWDTGSWTRMLSVSCKRWALVHSLALNLFPFQLVYLEVSGIEWFSSCVLSFEPFSSELHAHFKWLLWETNIHLMGLLTSISTFFCNVFLLSWKSKANFGPLWKCVLCCMCVWTGGALKPSTLKGLWVHITCGWFVPEVRFKDAAKMEPADGLIDINLSTFHQVCQIPIMSRIFLYYMLVILYYSCGS